MKKGYWVVIILLAVMFGRLVHTAWQKSATYDEALYITYGYSVLKTGDYRFSIDKPPLIPVISALPLLILNPKFDTNDEDWKKAAYWMDAKNPWGELGSYRWNFSLKFLYKNNIAPDKILFFSRISVISIVVLLGFLAFIRTKNIFGLTAGYYFLFFWTFCPNILGNSFLTTEDSIVSVLMYLSILSFLRLIDKPDYKTAILTGVFTGLALLSKHTALFLFPVYVIVLVIAFFTPSSFLLPEGEKRPTMGQLRGNYLVVFGIAILTILSLILLAYKFTYFQFYFYNIKNTLLYQKHGQATFCWGKHSFTGFWYYYLVCLLFKTPLPLLLLFILSPFKLFNRKISKNKLINVSALFITVILIIGFASFNKIQLGLRYILPAYVFIILISALVAEKYKVLSFIICGWFLFSSVKIHPDYLAYFNELAIGKGYSYLVDSNIDWGQDLQGLRKYVEQEKVTDVVLSYYGSGLAESTGLDFQDLYSFGLWGEKKHINSEKPQKEILAVSVTNLQGLYFTNIGNDLLYWLKEKEPDRIIGGSIFVYDITKDAYAHERLANIYFFTGQFEKALREALRTIELNPASGPAHLILSFMYVDYNGKEAVSRFREVAKVYPNLDFLYNKIITNTSARNAYFISFSKMKTLCERNGFKEGAIICSNWLKALQSAN